MPSRARSLAVSLLIGAVLGMLSPAVAMGAARVAGASATSQALPACHYQDVKTRYRQLTDWRVTLVDTNLKVTRAYVPHNLVPVSRANLPGSGRIRANVIPDLKAMALAASTAGAGIAVESAYRSYAQQVATFQMWVNRDGYSAALLASARPGHSEHQLGTTMDLRSADSTRAPWNYSDWALSTAGHWMKHNAWRYGFVMSYPKGETSVSCYQYEPWHYRYYGRELAADIHASHEVPRAYLWSHFETAG